MTNPNSNSLVSQPQPSIPTLQSSGSAASQATGVLSLANQNNSNQNPLSVATIDAQKKARLAGPSSKKVKFTKAEDAKLAMLVAEYSDNDWKTIAEHMAPRTARQCRERWTNYVNPSLSKDPWTPEEDLLLIEKHKEFGNHWKIIERYFNNRSKNNIKHRWASMKDNYSGASSISPDPAVQISISEPTSTPTNSTTTSPFPVPSVSEISGSSNSPSSEQPSVNPITSNISQSRRTNRKKSSNNNPLLAPSNIVATLAAAKSNKSSSQVTIPQINKIPQPVVNVVLQKQPQNQLHSQSIESIAEQSAPLIFQSQSASLSFPLQMPFLDSGAGGMGRNGGYGISTGIGGVSDFIGDVDVDTIREGDVSSYAALDPFQFFDRILDQHEVYVQSMDKTDFWSIPEENYF